MPREAAGCIQEFSASEKVQNAAASKMQDINTTLQKTHL